MLSPQIWLWGREGVAVGGLLSEPLSLKGGLPLLYPLPSQGTWNRPDQPPKAASCDTARRSPWSAAGKARVPLLPQPPESVLELGLRWGSPLCVFPLLFSRND